MMKKAILTHTDYRGPDGSVHVTDARLQRWVNNFRRMSAARMTIPIHWDRNNELPPGQRTAKNAVGRLQDVEPIAGGLELTLDITDPEAIVQANRGLIVSPAIFEWFAGGDGTVYEDCIPYVDLLGGAQDRTDVPPMVALSLDPGRIALALRVASPVKRHRLAWPVEQMSTEQVSALTNWALGRGPRP
jgi:hypothetical protein